MEPWIAVNRGHKKPPPVNHATYHQIPVIKNRYDLLGKWENYDLIARELMGTHEPKVKNENRDMVHNAKNKHVKNKHKIIVIGDSHARGCAAEIQLNLDEHFEVQGFVIAIVIVTPGTGVSTITTSAKSDIQHLSKQDVVVVWGGSTDVGKNETNKGINCIQRYIKTNNHTNFIIMHVPHRYDLEQNTCVNKEVEKYNRRIRKHMKVSENTEVIKVDLEEVSQDMVSI